MADVYNYVETTGVITTNAADILTEVQQEYINTFGADLNTDPSTPQGMLISIETNSRVALADNNVALANQINPNVAGGIFLDALMQLTGIQRIPSTPSTVNCNITGIAGTFIIAGSQISTSDGTTVFQLVSDVTIPSSGILNNVPFDSVIDGPIAAESGSLTTIVSAILGWETVTNPLDATLGNETQSDTQARLLRLNALGEQGNSLAANVIAALYLIPGVSTAGLTFRENVTGTTQVIDQTSMVGHSIYLCVGGSTEYATIASNIQNSKSAGCAYNNGLGIPIQQIYTDPNSMQDITVLFDTPSIVTVSINVTVHAFTTIQNVMQAVQTAILNYAGGGLPGQPGFVVGAAVSPFQIAGAIMQQITGIFVQEVEVGINSFTQQGLITNASTSVTNLTYNAPVGGFIGIATGMLVSDAGNNIPNGTTVSALVGSTGITLSSAAVFSSFTLQGTIANTSTTVTGLTDTSTIVVGMGITGTGIPGSTVVSTIVDSNSITISNAATADATEILTFTPASGATLTDVLTFTQTPSYATTEIPLGIWQQAFTSAALITVVQV